MTYSEFCDQIAPSVLESECSGRIKDKWISAYSWISRNGYGRFFQGVNG